MNFDIGMYLAEHTMYFRHYLYRNNSNSYVISLSYKKLIYTNGFFYIVPEMAMVLLVRMFNIKRTGRISYLLHGKKPLEN